MRLFSFLCKHKEFQLMKRTLLETKREKTGQYVIGLPVYCTYMYCEEKRKCKKCNKEYIVIVKYITKVEGSSVLY